MSRADFRERVCERDGGECLVYSCNESVTPDPDGPGEQHHIIERKLWEDGGYIEDNGANVCNTHHRLAERNVIPPQSLWRWARIENPPLPDSVASRHHANDVDKWGEFLGAPPWREHRDRVKYPSTRHLPWSHERDDDDTAFERVEQFVDIPLVATIKMDGGNCMVVRDSENPIRARNGRHADKEHFDMAKQWYWENGIYEEIPEHLQVFGEWLYAKHSIHYGCDCDETCEDVGPALRDYFQVFGMYDTRYDVWLGWRETRDVSQQLGMTLVPPADGSTYGVGQFDNSKHFWSYAYDLSQNAVNDGHEGIVVRSMYPFQYSDISRRLGKYVRPGHVKEGEKHWSNRPLVQNQLR